MRKIVALCVSIVMIVLLAGCGMKVATIPEENKTTISEIAKGSDGINAICKKLNEKEYITDNCVCVITNASLIGAKTGYRFDKVSVNGSNFSVEIYEYDDTSSETAKKVINSVKSNNEFEIFGRNVPYSYMSNNDKYLLIYPDNKSTSNKADDIKNKEALDEFLKIINSQK